MSNKPFNLCVTLLAAACVGGVAVLSGCASSGGSGNTTLSSGGGAGVVASEASVANVARVGFLTDYAKLQPAPGGGGLLCWRRDAICAVLPSSCLRSNSPAFSA